MTRPRSSGLFMLAAGVACLAPVLVLAAALGTRAGLWGVDLGYDLLTRKIAFWLSFPGILGGVGALVLASRAGRGRIVGVAATVIALTTLGGFVWHTSRTTNGAIEDVSTDLAEIPGFGPLAGAHGNAGPPGTIGVAGCPTAIQVPTQAVPESVVYVLQHEGFSVRRAGVTGVYGTRRSFWFGFTYDVAVRIRPRRTDIRVAARDARPHGGEACRLVGRISAALSQGS